MANLIRTAKSGNDWTSNELAAYHIECRREDPLQFFGVDALPEPQVPPDLLDAPDPTQVTDDATRELLRLLHLAMYPPIAGESVVHDFAAVLFRALGYAQRDRVIQTRTDLCLSICGERRPVQADVCIVDCSGWRSGRYDMLLVVQEDKRFGPSRGADPEAQLIAQAIAAFCANGWDRASCVEPLGEKVTFVFWGVIAGMTMMGTTPTFYKIPVTRALAQHVAQGTYPPDPVHVTFCFPPYARPGLQEIEGMKPLDNRRQILSCYEAFKTVIGI